MIDSLPPASNSPEDGQPEIIIQPLADVEGFNREEHDDGVLITLMQGNKQFSFAINDRAAIDVAKTLWQVCGELERRRQIENWYNEKDDDEPDSEPDPDPIPVSPKCPFNFRKPF